MKCVPKHSRDHDDSEYVSYVERDRKGAEFTGNKQKTCKQSTFYINKDTEVKT